MRPVRLRAYAKVNLGLEVLGLRDDGYHELRTLFQTIDLHDDVVLRPGKPAGSQSVWYFIGEQLVAVDAMSDAAAFVTAKKLLERGASVPKAAVCDPGAEFKTWLA